MSLVIVVGMVDSRCRKVYIGLRQFRLQAFRVAASLGILGGVNSAEADIVRGPAGGANGSDVADADGLVGYSGGVAY